jgi:hypothetical protein
MDPFQMVIVIVLIVFGSKAFKYYLEHKENFSTKHSGMDIEKILMSLDAQKKINQALEKRIQALETIIIQDDYELNRKFKEL